MLKSVNRIKRVGNTDRICSSSSFSDVWTPEEEVTLIETLQDINITKIKWKLVAKKLPGNTIEQCQLKWKDVLKKGDSSNKWTREEDKILKKWVEKHGAKHWTHCASLIIGRNGKQCRERWINILDPVIKIGGWSDKEQAKIFECLMEYSTSWSKVSKHLKGRTENAIKNYFYSTIRRIQSYETHEFFFLMKQNQETLSRDSLDDFEEKYQLNRLNLLGQLICKWLFRKEEAKKEHLALFEYLLKMIAIEKKNVSSKRGKDLVRNSESASTGIDDFSRFESDTDLSTCQSQTPIKSRFEKSRAQRAEEKAEQKMILSFNNAVSPIIQPPADIGDRVDASKLYVEKGSYNGNQLIKIAENQKSIDKSILVDESQDLKLEAADSRSEAKDLNCEFEMHASDTTVESEAGQSIVSYFNSAEHFTEILEHTIRSGALFSDELRLSFCTIEGCSFEQYFCPEISIFNHPPVHQSIEFLPQRETQANHLVCCKCMTVSRDCACQIVK